MPSFQKPPTVSDDYRAVDIYRKAADIIYAKGFNATSMGDIAEAVDLTKGGLYYYIKGKKALLFAIMNFAMDLLEQEVLTPAQEEDDAEKRLATMISNHVRAVIQDPSAMSILVYEEENLNPDHRERIVARKRDFGLMLRDSIRAVQKIHAPDSELDPVVASYGLLGMIHWVVRWYKDDGRLDRDQVAEQMTHLVLRGLLCSYPAP